VFAAVGSVLATVSGVATAQNGINLAAGSALATASVRGLDADGVELLPAHGPFGGTESPSMMIRLSDVRVDSVCVRFRSLDVPLLGEVALVGRLDKEDALGAKNIVVDANRIQGDLLLDGVAIGNGIGGPTDRTDSGGIAVTGRALDAPGIEIDTMGVTADQVTLKGIDIGVERGPGTC